MTVLNILSEQKNKSSFLIQKTNGAYSSYIALGIVEAGFIPEIGQDITYPIKPTVDRGVQTNTVKLSESNLIDCLKLATYSGRGVFFYHGSITGSKGMPIEEKENSMFAYYTSELPTGEIIENIDFTVNNHINNVYFFNTLRENNTLYDLFLITDKTIEIVRGENNWVSFYNIGSEKTGDNTIEITGKFTVGYRNKGEVISIKQNTLSKIKNDLAYTFTSKGFVFNNPLPSVWLSMDFDPLPNYKQIGELTITSNCDTDIIRGCTNGIKTGEGLGQTNRGYFPQIDLEQYRTGFFVSDRVDGGQSFSIYKKNGQFELIEDFSDGEIDLGLVEGGFTDNVVVYRQKDGINPLNITGEFDKFVPFFFSEGRKYDLSNPMTLRAFFDMQEYLWRCAYNLGLVFIKTNGRTASVNLFTVPEIVSPFVPRSFEYAVGLSNGSIESLYTRKLIVEPSGYKEYLDALDSPSIQKGFYLSFLNMDGIGANRFRIGNVPEIFNFPSATRNVYIVGHDVDRSMFELSMETNILDSYINLAVPTTDLIKYVTIMVDSVVSGSIVSRAFFLVRLEEFNPFIALV